MKDSQIYDLTRHAQPLCEEDLLLRSVEKTTSNQNANMFTPRDKNHIQFKSSYHHKSHKSNNFQFNQTLQQQSKQPIFSPTSLGDPFSGQKTKTKQLNKMLKHIINDTNPTYSQLAQVSSVKSLHGNNGLSQYVTQTSSSKPQSGQKNIAGGKITAIQNFKKQQCSSSRNKLSINIQSSLLHSTKPKS